MDFKYNTIEEAIEAIKAGKMVLVTDDEDRENEGDLIMAAELCTPEAINFMAKEARGLICMPASGPAPHRRPADPDHRSAGCPHALQGPGDPAPGRRLLRSERHQQEPDSG